MKIIKDEWGNLYKVIGGEIKHGDMALNEDTGDVIYIDDDCDLWFRNETCTLLKQINKIEL